MIGAAAMAVHGVSRSTRDLDLFTTQEECLADRFWDDLAATCIEVRVRRGDADDPLAGVVRFTRGVEYPVDLVVGKSPWQAGIAARARATRIEGVDVPVAGRVDLILMKLYAGGPQDAWDVEQLLADPERDALTARVEAGLAALPSRCREQWTRIRGLGGEA